MKLIKNAIESKEWINVNDSPMPNDFDGHPFWVTVNDGAMSRIEVVILTGEGLFYTDSFSGEHFWKIDEKDQITHWMPLTRPLYPAKDIGTADMIASVFQATSDVIEEGK